MFPPHCVVGSGEEEIVAELAGLAARVVVVRKRRYSGFFGTIKRRLNELAPDEVEVVGVCTDICVLHTVADLRNRDYRVVVPRALVDTYDGPGHDAALVESLGRWPICTTCSERRSPSAA